jgi:hypothetical protein
MSANAHTCSNDQGMCVSSVRGGEICHEHVALKLIVM